MPAFAHPTLTWPALALAAALALSACSKTDAPTGAAKPGAAAPGGGGAPGGAGGGMPGIPVGFITVQAGAAPIGTELPGRLEPFRQAQVRARVSGIVQQRLFAEGSLVRAGQPLYRLDADSYRANLASAQAQAAKVEADVAQAQAEVERKRPLAAERAISQQEWLATQTALRQAEAARAAAKAAIDAARVPLGQATVTAPISGRVGRSLASEGALVGPADPNPLTTIQQNNPLYVNFTQSVNDMLKLRREIDSGAVKRLPDGAAQVQVLMEDGSLYPAPARLLFTDPTVDPVTGQVTIRAEVPNPDGLLLPGLFVRVRLTQAVSDRAMLIPQQAVQRGSAGDTVLVLDAENKAQPRPVQIGGAQGSNWVVLGGLKAGERVVVDGFQKMQMMRGAPLMPVPWTPGGATAGGPASAPAAAASAAGAKPAPVGAAPASAAQASAAR